MHSFVGRVMIYISSIFYTDNWLFVTNYDITCFSLGRYTGAVSSKNEMYFFYWIGMRFRDK